MKKEVFESDNITKSILTMVVPSVLSSLIVIIYNITDIFFIGQTNDQFKVSGIAVSIPIALLIIALGNIFGVGGASLVSRLLGKKNYISCKTASSFCCYFGLILAFIYNILVFFFASKLVYLIGASEQSATFAKDYLITISCGAYFSIFNIIFSNLIRAEGLSKTSTIGVFLGHMVNIILDPILILYFDLGTFGAGAATVIGNMCSSFYFLRYVRKSSSTCLSVNFCDFKIKKLIIYEIITIGFPASLSGFLLTAADVVLNNILNDYGDEVIAGMGIARRVFSMSPIILIGFAQGVLPLIGFNFSAFKYDKMKKILYKSLKMSFCIGACIFLGFFFFAPYIASLFIDNKEVVDYATLFLRIISFGAPCMSIIFMFIVFFQATGNALPPLILTLSRQFLVFIPFVIIGNYLFGLKGVVAVLPFSDFFNLIVSYSIFTFYKKRYFSKPL